jgi:hypothetical protein
MAQFRDDVSDAAKRRGIEPAVEGAFGDDQDPNDESGTRP